MDRLIFFLRKLFLKILPEVKLLTNNNISWKTIESCKINSTVPSNVYLGKVYKIYDSNIGEYTSIAENAKISMTTIGKYCSIGPNFISGWGIHPTNGITTSPIFYSTQHATGKTLSKDDKITERMPIEIGNDVWVGANCFILDGVKIGNGAIIAAGAIVTKDVANYSIVGGIPAKHIKYRFNEEQIKELEKIKWWDFDDDSLKDVERNFFDIDGFIKKYKKTK